MNSTGRKKTLLIVEDDIAIRETFIEILESEGYSVVSAENGLEAVGVLQRGLKPSLILLDLMMPVMDGFSFRTRQMENSDWAGFPVMVLSAEVRMKDTLDFFKGSAYLQKPPDIDQLIQMVGENCL